MAKRDTPAAGGSSSVTTTPEAIVITRTFGAPRELVFKAWTRAESLKQFLGPKGFTTPVLTIDPRPGGLLHYCMRSPDGRDYWQKGVFREVAPPERIVYLNSLSDEYGNTVEPSRAGITGSFPRESVVTVTFAEHGRTTTVTLRHELPASAMGRDRAAEGWSQMLERLADYLMAA